jgi:hypothetical protein
MVYGLPVYVSDTLTVSESAVWPPASVTVHFHTLTRVSVTALTKALNLVLAEVGELALVLLSPLTRDHA